MLFTNDVEQEFSEVRLDRCVPLRGVFPTSFAVAAGANPGAALGAAPGGRTVLGAVVERPVALHAALEAGPDPALLSSEHDRGQPTDGVVQPARVGREQLEPTSLVGPGVQEHGADSAAESLGSLRDERETCVGQQERAQRLAQAPGAPEVLVGKRGRGRHKPVLGKPEGEAGRITDLVGIWQDVQSVDEVADEFQAPWSRQAPVVPIGCHVYILSRPPDRPRSEGRC